MKTWAVAWWLGVVLTSSAAPETRTVSASRQFVVHGPDAIQTASLCARAENLKREFLRLLDLTDQWRDPILIYIRPRSAEATNALTATVETFIGDTGFKYLVQWRVSPHDDAAVLPVITEALCREYANRKLWERRPLPAMGARLPMWFTVGLHQVLANRGDELLPSLRRAVTAGRPVRWEELDDALTRPATDAAAHRLAEAHAWQAVESLGRLPGGTRNLRAVLDAAAPEVAPADLFDVVAGCWVGVGEAREAWWQQQLARKVSTWLPAGLTARETSAELRAIALTRLGTNEPPVLVPLEDLARHARESWWHDRLREQALRLRLLQGQTHPLYVAAVEKYAEAVQQFQGRGFSRARSVARQAGRLHQQADARSRELADYVDRVEVESGRADWSVLDRHRATLEWVESMNELRRDPVREYLDRFESAQ